MTTDIMNYGTLTSLVQLFGQTINGTLVQAIEIPLFQRDYAQGRHNEQARLVRTRFISDMCAALDSNQYLHLDFVFGDVIDGTLYPLDGQQRLTTLFLLHCYLAWHQPEIGPQPWHAFHYATRPGARQFCKFLTLCRPDMSQMILSEWICDQASYLSSWNHDPTVQSMLVVLDALHQHYREHTNEKMNISWRHLTDPVNPGIRFLLLPVAAQQLNNSLYVKMNSRGRPLTEFENFKADLEALLVKNPVIDRTLVEEFTHKIDSEWADLFWEYSKTEVEAVMSSKGMIDSKVLLDDKCMRYLRFLFEVLAWKRHLKVHTGQGDLQALTILSEALLGHAAPDAQNDLNWIVKAFDIWLEKGVDGNPKPKAIHAFFSQLFTREALSKKMPLRVFSLPDFGVEPEGVDMLHACSLSYGTGVWKLPHTILFYGVLQALLQELSTLEILPRLRLLRNLIEASRNEIRADNTRNNMPALLSEVEAIMANRPLCDVKIFNQVQVLNEQAKKNLLAAHPALEDFVSLLEDHVLLRGGLTVFELNPLDDPSIFYKRAEQFYFLFSQPYQLVSAALVAKGHKGRGYQRSSGYSLFYLGAPRQSGIWEDHWRIRHNEPFHPSKAALMELLDDMAAGFMPQTVIDTFLADPSTPKDWRYYVAKYECMRGESLDFAGYYVLSPYPGYAMCMLKSDSCDNRSNHHDAYLLALANAAELEQHHIGNIGWPRCFPGYETEERYLILGKSGLKVRCVENGWLWDTSALNDVAQLDIFMQIVSQYKTEAISSGSTSWLTLIDQRNGIDLVDRIVKGAELLKLLIKKGM
jgi:hypothetical protein